MFFNDVCKRYILLVNSAVHTEKAKEKKLFLLNLLKSLHDTLGINLGKTFKEYYCGKK